MESIERYLARDSDQNVAVLKLLHEPARSDATALNRLEREVEVLSKVNDRSLIRIVDADPRSGWYVTPYYRGGTLAEHLASYAGDPEAALYALLPLVEGVAKLHEMGVVHRDIKPENIFMSHARLVLGDFGIVYFTDDRQHRLSESYENVGSRDWMPGWAMGMRLDDVRPNFDVFSLGKVLWAMVSGRTKMQLWYFDDERYDLRRQFPYDERIPWIHRLLTGSVRERQEHVWVHAEAMRAEMLKVIQAIRRGGQVVSREVNRACRVCGIGIYEVAAPEDNHAALNNLGFRPAGEKLRPFSCSHCGHIELFRMTFRPSAWGELQ
jgi:serine/threonine protein kinase